MTEFERGAIAMREKIEAMLREHSEAAKAQAQSYRRISISHALTLEAALLWGFANAVMDMPTPDPATVREAAR